MGWDFYCDPYYNKARLIEELCKGFTGEKVTYRVLDHAVAGGELWRVVEINDEGKVTRQIWRDLIKGGGKGSGWGHKAVPYYEGVSCPKRLLDMVMNDGTERDETFRIICAEERHGKAQRAKKRKAIVPGAKVEIYGKTYEVLQKHWRRGWLVRQDDNRRTYRATTGINPL